MKKTLTLLIDIISECVCGNVSQINNTKNVVEYPSCLPLSSPRAKRAGLKGLRAESARAVTGRRCPHSGKGEDFFTETAVTPERKVQNSFPRSEINRHAEG